MEGSWLGLVGFLMVAVGLAGVLLWPRFRESLAREQPVVVEAVDAFRRAVDAESGEVAQAALQAEVGDLRANRAEWHRRLRAEGVSEDVHTALDRV